MFDFIAASLKKTNVLSLAPVCNSKGFGVGLPHY